LTKTPHWTSACNKEALLQRPDNLRAVAGLVGYSNTQRFNKKPVGVTPGEYRRACG